MAKTSMAALKTALRTRPGETRISDHFQMMMMKSLMNFGDDVVIMVMIMLACQKNPTITNWYDVGKTPEIVGLNPHQKIHTSP